MRLIAVLLCFFCVFAHAEEKVSPPKHIIILPEGTVVKGDYFAMGDSIEISGEVQGDVYLLGSQIFIDGTIHGDVLAAGGSVEITGQVDNNIRVLGGQVIVSGQVSRNATIVAGSAQLSSAGTIGGNLVCTAGNFDMGGSVGGEATIAASNMRLSNTVGNNLNAYVGQLRLTSKARVGGDLEYYSNQEAYIDPGAKITGKVEHYKSLVGEIFHGKWLHKFLVGSKVAAVMMNFIYTLVIGCILIRIFPKNLESVLETLQEKPWKALSIGIMLLILLPLASLILLMTILGVPFALTLIALNIVTFYTAKIYSIIWASNKLFTRFGFKESKIPILTMGLISYFILMAIPYVGSIVSLAAMLFGIGAGVLAQTPKKLFH